MNRLRRVLSIVSLVVVTAFAGISTLAAPQHPVRIPGIGHSNNIIVPAGDDNGGDH